MERTLRLFIHLLFVLGLLAGIAIWFVDDPSPTSWPGRTLAPRYAPALLGYRQHIGSTSSLSSHHQGFDELLELATSQAAGIPKGRVATLRLGGFGATPSGNGILIECLDTAGRQVGNVWILNPETAIREHFFQRRVRVAKGAFSFVSFMLSAGMYIAQAVEGRRREKRAAAELTRVNEELEETRNRQTPSAVFDAVKEEAEWVERAGGPKSPFLTDEQARGRRLHR